MHEYTRHHYTDTSKGEALGPSSSDRTVVFAAAAVPDPPHAVNPTEQLHQNPVASGHDAAPHQQNAHDQNASGHAALTAPTAGAFGHL